jgi:TolB protein
LVSENSSINRFGEIGEIIMRKISKYLHIVLACLFIPHVSTSFAGAEVGITMAKPSPSPTGAELVMAADFDGHVGLWITDINGSRLRKLTSNTDGDRDPNWSPDGQSIAFSRRQGGASDIFLIRPDGAGLTQVTAKVLNNKQPSWSADGKLLVYVSNRAGSNDLWISNLDSKFTRRLTFLPGQENHPSFSPDGTQIVFSETVGASAWLMIVNADGTGLHQLTMSGSQRDWNPNWSRYGIVFSSDRGNSEHFKIWTIRPDGTGLAPLGDVAALDPVWMPNGRLLFADELGPGAALATITELDPQTGTKRVVNNRQGYLVSVDIRPGSAVNRIHPGGHGTVRVAILTSKDFDVFSAVDKATLTFGRTGNEASLLRCGRRGKDINGDGLRDLICRFNISLTGFQFGDSTGILRLKTHDGIPYEGRDSVVTIQSDDDEDNDDKDDD